MKLTHLDESAQRIFDRIVNDAREADLIGAIRLTKELQEILSIFKQLNLALETIEQMEQETAADATTLRLMKHQLHKAFSLLSQYPEHKEWLKEVGYEAK